MYGICIPTFTININWTKCRNIYHTWILCASSKQAEHLRAQKSPGRSNFRGGFLVPTSDPSWLEITYPSIEPPGQKSELVEGKIKNVAAPQIAIKFWNMPSDATLRDPWIYNNRRFDLMDVFWLHFTFPPIITVHWKNASRAIVVAFQMQPFTTSIIIGERVHRVDVSLHVRFPAMKEKIGTCLQWAGWYKVFYPHMACKWRVYQ